MTGMKSPKAIVPIKDGKSFLYIGINASESGLVKLAWMPHDPPRYITVPIRKNTFKVPNELNLVKNVGDLTQVIGNRIIR